MYLAHRFLDFNSNEVFVSPLTCKSALTPIIAAGKKINFIDIDEETLLCDESKLWSRIQNKNCVVQLINLSGNMYSENFLKKVYSKSNIIVIEDCAQSFGSRMKNSSTFPRSEILCYSLSKNLYSFGGGF